MESTDKDLKSEEGCRPLSNFVLQTEMGIYETLRLLSFLEFVDQLSATELTANCLKIAGRAAAARVVRGTADRRR